MNVGLAVEAYGNRSQLTAAGGSSAAGAVIRPPLCKGRIWCGYEYDAWALGLVVAFLVGTWWAIKKALLELQRDQGTEAAKEKKLKKAAEKREQAKKDREENDLLAGQQGGERPGRTANPADDYITHNDPGTGKEYYEHKVTREVVWAIPMMKRIDTQLSNSRDSDPRGPRGSTDLEGDDVAMAVAGMQQNKRGSVARRKGRMSMARPKAKTKSGGAALDSTAKGASNLKKTTKPLSTAIGERLTSLGPARFLASMHIVAGHLYQKSALGPLFLLSWGYTWVPWFFMLSGYVLMHARLNSRTPDKVDLPLTALWKRTSSIFPMYAVGVVLDMLCFCARGTPLPGYHVLFAQSFLLQSWMSYFTEKALQSHCWFLSAMVIYWLSFGPVYRMTRHLSLGKTVTLMVVITLLPWLAVIIPAAMGNLAFYKTHRTGVLATELDHITVTLKFNPICYFHVFLFGMCLARFRRHVTRREDSYETKNAPRPRLQWCLLVPFRAGASLGYIILIIVFLSLKEAGAAKAKISARLGLFMPMQGLILLGLSPLRGLQRDPSEVRRWWQQYGADPLANLFKMCPGWIGDVSYAQYVLQILAYTVYPVRLDVFGRWGFIPFFAWLQGVSFLAAMTIQTPARKAWMRPRNNQGRYMLVWPIALALLLFLTKGIQDAVLAGRRASGGLPGPYTSLQGAAFWETSDRACAQDLYSSSDGAAVAAVDVQLNWTAAPTDAGDTNFSKGAVINPSVLLIRSPGGKAGFTVIRAARVHRMEESEKLTVLDNVSYFNGTMTVTEVTHTWHSAVVAAEAKEVPCDFSSWDPQQWGLDGQVGGASVPGAGDAPAATGAAAGVGAVGGAAMYPTSMVTSRATKEAWDTRLCRLTPVWVPENKTLVYKVVTGAEDPKLFLLPADSPHSDTHGHMHSLATASRRWAMLFSSLPPVNTIDGGAAACDATKKASVQMYVAMGVPELISVPLAPAPTVPPPAGMRVVCAKKERDEKNWIPFNVGAATYFVYSISPHVVLRGRPADGACVPAYSSNAFAPLNDLASRVGAGRIHGSATAEPFGRGRFLALLHTKLGGGKGYTTMAYMFSATPPFQVLAVSRPLPLQGGGLAFPSGLVVMEKEARVVVTYGVADAQSRAMVMTRVALRDLFTWRGCSNHDFAWWNSSWPQDKPRQAAGSAAGSAAAPASPPGGGGGTSVDWTKGFSGKAEDQTAAVKSGEVLTFVWTGNHNVFLMKDKAAFDACDFSAATELGSASPVLHTMGTATTYFACQVGTHCVSGQRLSAVATNAPNPTPAAPTPVVAVKAMSAECAAAKASEAASGLGSLGVVAVYAGDGVCENCNNASYCPSATTEVFYTCGKGFTPARVRLSDPALNMFVSVVVIALLVGAVKGVGAWKGRRLRREFINNPSVRDPDALAALSDAKKKKPGGGTQPTKAGGAKQPTTPRGKTKDKRKSGNLSGWGEAGSPRGGGGRRTSMAVGKRSRGDEFVSFYILPDPNAVDPATGEAATIGPYNRFDMKEALESGNIGSTTLVCGTDASGNDPKGEGWIEVQLIAGLPPSNAPEWYALGDDGIMEGPYALPVMRGWLDAGSVAPELYISNGGDWAELHEVIDDADEEEAASMKKAAPTSAWENRNGKAKGGKAKGEPKRKNGLASMIPSLFGDKNKTTKKEHDDAALEAKMQMMWYVYYEGEDPVGPYPGSMLNDWLRHGDMVGGNLVCPVAVAGAEGEAGAWVAVSSVFGDTGGAGGAEGGQGGGASFCSACWKRATGAGKTGNAITSNGERRTTNPMYGSGVEMKTVEGEEWSIHVDETSGYKYRLNTRTGETAWITNDETSDPIRKKMGKAKASDHV
jgi:peptidoglycan/LPS O-acetylase OafA/YrhL